MSTPDITVVVPVYNTMPYLRKCLASLTAQSIGRDRMQIIAVDDGSTDGSSRELDRLAARYPDTVTVLHQPNSGGPAGPCNRALDLATGRYVFFVGSDDHLGHEALQRLVTAADEYDADVVLGRVVGVNSRYVSQEIFARSQVDIGLFDSALPWSLANTKLFRRQLIERHGIRFPEDMPVLSDQPFTIEACLRARRISVLADYDYYYAVRRLNSRNITYSSRREVRLRCIGALMGFVAKLIDVDEHRDALLVRHFDLELAGLLTDDFRRLERTTQARIHDGVRQLVRQHLSPAVRDRLGIETRLRLSVAAEGDLDDLLAVIRQDAEVGVPPTVVVGDRWYAGYPGPPVYHPHSWRDVTEVRANWLAKLDATGVAWDGAGGLTVTARSPHPYLTDPAAATVRLTAGEVGGTTIATHRDHTGLTVRVRFDVDRLLACSAPSGRRQVVRTQVSTAGLAGAAPLRALRLGPVRRRVYRRGARVYLVTPTRDHRGQVLISVVPVTTRRILARVLRGWPVPSRSERAPAVRSGGFFGQLTVPARLMRAWWMLARRS